MSRKFKDISLMQFGRLRPSYPVGVSQNRNIWWACLCDCGDTVTVSGDSLRRGATRSCGCLQRETASETISVVSTGRLGRKNPNFRHGHNTDANGQSPTWRSWQSMTQRCTNTKATGFETYGGDGHKVCERWRGEHGFENFLADMGERAEGTTLSRYLDSGNYEPGNVEWATWAQQGAERRGKTAMLVLHGYHQFQMVAA